MTRTLVVNAGSSTLKMAVVNDRSYVERSFVHDDWDGDPASLLSDFAAPSGPVEAVGHRVVHGGRHQRAAVITDGLVGELTTLVELAPLHQPRALAAIAAARRCLPDVAQVACFDTAFHSTLAPAASTYALPAEWRSRWGLRRYGFHGLSHSWVARRAPVLASVDPARARIVSCHLGSGASLSAIRAGRSVDTTMGFTPLEGLVMATRSGSVDPGVLVWLVRSGRLGIEALAEGLERSSGLAGLTSTNGDMRAVLAARESGDTEAALALDVYVHRLRSAIAAMAASLGGLDVLAFTGGVGVHQPVVRELAVAGLAFLGITVDLVANAAADGDAVITGTGPTSVVVVATGEELEIARQVEAVTAR